MTKAYIIAQSAISYRRYITRSAGNGYHCKKHAEACFLHGGDRGDRTPDLTDVNRALWPAELCLRIPSYKHTVKSKWSEWQDSNLRSHGPKPRALPTALHPDIKPMKRAAWPPVPNFCLAAKIFRAENDSLNRFLNALNPSLPLRGAASWSQTTRATNCATPGYKTN